MATTRHKTLSVPIPVSDLFAVTVYTIQQRGHDIRGLSNEISEVLFVSGKTPMSWGHVWAASVVEEGAGSVLQMTVDGVDGAPKALLDGWKNGKTLDKFLAAVEENLTISPRPQPEPVESFQITDDGSVVPWTTRDLSGN